MQKQRHTMASGNGSNFESQQFVSTSKFARALHWDTHRSREVAQGDQMTVDLATANSGEVH